MRRSRNGRWRRRRRRPSPSSGPANNRRRRAQWRLQFRRGPMGPRLARQGGSAKQRRGRQKQPCVARRRRRRRVRGRSRPVLWLRNAERSAADFRRLAPRRHFQGRRRKRGPSQAPQCDAQAPPVCRRLGSRAVRKRAPPLRRPRQRRLAPLTPRSQTSCTALVGHRASGRRRQKTRSPHTTPPTCLGRTSAASTAQRLAAMARGRRASHRRPRLRT
mmetsp:Transcript_119666/g.343750  ORF Transcript_119666/g.343750 Transcript_119666/m.343750 type:complete len:217 (-) Transcript_119666:318-968(-)